MNTIKKKTDHSKPLSEIRVLDILRKYSESSHPLLQKGIIDILARDYGIEIERKAVGRILTKLEAAGYPIERTGNGVYIENEDFDESELRFLIDAVLFSRHISSRYAHDLIEKIKMLGNVYFRQRLTSVYSAEMISRENHPELFFNVDTIANAISQDKMIDFVYNEYGLDKKLHPLFSDRICVDPYHLVAAGNHYYLVGKHVGENKSAIVSYRVEKMSDIVITDKRRDKKKNGMIDFDLNEYLSAHPYMFAATEDCIEEVTLKIERQVLGDFIDAFGLDFGVINEGEFDAVVRVKAGRSDVFDWLKRFGDRVEVISPLSLRKQMSKYAEKLFYYYNKYPDYTYTDQVERAKDPARKDHSDHIYLCNINLKNRTEHHFLDKVKRAAFCRNSVSDFSFLSNYSSLAELTIETNPVNNLDALAKCKKLSFLHLRNTDVRSIAFVTELPQLNSLHLYKNPIEDLSPIYRCEGLKNLKMDVATALKLDEKELAKLNARIVIYETFMTGKNDPRKLFAACKTQEDWDKIERIVTNYSLGMCLTAFSEARYAVEHGEESGIVQI